MYGWTVKADFSQNTAANMYIGKYTCTTTDATPQMQTAKISQKKE